MGMLEAATVKLFPLLMILGPLSQLVAIALAPVFYFRHRDRVEPGRRVPGLAYVAAVIFFGATAGYFGLMSGINLACSSPASGNLCGLWGFFVTGPLALALAIVLIGLSLSLVGPASRQQE